MKKIFQTILIATALTLAWGCSSSDSDDEPNGSGQTVSPPHSCQRTSFVGCHLHPSSR